MNTNSQTTHAPSHLREQFQEWLDAFEPSRLHEIDVRSHESQQGATGTTKRRYAEVAWCIEDITSRYHASPEEADKLLADIEKWLGEAMVRQGWDFIDNAAAERGIKAKPEEEWDF